MIKVSTLRKITWSQQNRTTDVIRHELWSVLEVKRWDQKIIDHKSLFEWCVTNIETKMNRISYIISHHHRLPFTLSGSNFTKPRRVCGTLNHVYVFALLWTSMCTIAHVSAWPSLWASVFPSIFMCVLLYLSACPWTVMSGERVPHHGQVRTDTIFMFPLVRGLELTFFLIS